MMTSECDQVMRRKQFKLKVKVKVMHRRKAITTVKVHNANYSEIISRRFR